ncbi:MAG: RtcB family protein [Phycisphaerales bacterium]|nr:RtcB family protein [Phycisphaerales bacterium]
MRVDGIVYADDRLVESIRNDYSLEQVANVACLPGIVRHSLAMPDIHFGYGFCIGGVAATNPADGGVISPGGVGYDINCGVRLIRTNLTEADVRPRLNDLVNQLFRDVPTGVGARSPVQFTRQELKQLMREGSKFVVDRGYGLADDVEVTEGHGRLDGADPDAVSERAVERGMGQCGTLGSGNHFMEVQVVQKIFEPTAAEVMGLREGGVCVMIHSGSRGLGYQVCDDYVRELNDTPRKFGIDLPDPQLVCAPVHSNEGQRYLAAMRAAANYAWCNRQILTHLARGAFEHLFKLRPPQLGMTMIYDVAHNIAKMEPYDVDGKSCQLCVHRKGATRAFPPGHPEIPRRYRDIGQPVLIPGDMGRNSYVLVGREGSMKETFGSSCHGAGRLMSRGAAIRDAKGRSIRNELLEKGIVARARGRTGLDEEQPAAYKDVNEVVHVVDAAGLSQRVCQLRPIGVIKG